MKRLACAGAAVTAVVVLGIAPGCGGSPGKKRPLTQQEMIAADPLPLAKGSRWTYQVEVKRFDPETDKVTTKTIPWTTEVIDTKASNGVVAFRVRGWPTDLTDYDGVAPVPTPTEMTILRKGNNFLFGATAEPDLHGATGWFSWPVLDGQKICPSAEVVYCWQVSSVETGYKLTFITGPDEQSFELEPGTGIARFHYANRSTTNEVDAKLVSYKTAADR